MIKWTFHQPKLLFFLAEDTFFIARPQHSTKNNPFTTDGRKFSERVFTKTTFRQGFFDIFVHKVVFLHSDMKKPLNSFVDWKEKTSYLINNEEDCWRSLEFRFFLSKQKTFLCNFHSSMSCKQGRDIYFFHPQHHHLILLIFSPTNNARFL